MKYLAFIPTLFLALDVAYAGDRYVGYEKFAGAWRLENCTGGEKIKEEQSDLSVSLTESRSSAVNVYLLNSKGKKVRLLFSTSPMLAKSAVFTLEQDNSGVSGIDVSLFSYEKMLKVQIQQNDANGISYIRSFNNETVICDMKRL